MKRLLLLLFLFPVILSAQTQHKDYNASYKNDTIKNIQSITDINGRYAGTRMGNIRTTHSVSDSGEYYTTVVFFHNLTALDSADYDTVALAMPADAVTINTEIIPAGTIQIISDLPPLPLVRDESLTGLSIPDLVSITTEIISGDRADILTTLPLLPLIREESLTFIELNGTVAINTEVMAAVEDEIINNLPPLPLVKEESLTSCSHLDIISITTGSIAVAEADVLTTLPELPAVITGEFDDFPFYAVAQIKTEAIPPGVMETFAPPPPVRIVIEDELYDIMTQPVYAIITGNIPAEKAEILDSFPIVEEKIYPVDEMHLSEEGYSLLEKLEGYSPELYSLNDGGYTIGFGFFIPYSEGLKWRKGITWEEAERLIHQKVPAYENQVKEFINVLLTQKEFDALTMLAYNLGGFSKATSIVNDVNNLEGYDQLQTDWKRFIHSKAPNVSKGLMNRRKDELGVRLISDYQPERKVIIYKNRN